MPGLGPFGRNFHMFKKSAERSFMEKNRIGKVCVCLLTLTMSLQALFCNSVIAEETFVSEEEAVIGGEENEIVLPVQSQPVADAVMRAEPEPGPGQDVSLQEEVHPGKQQTLPKEEGENQELSANSVSKNEVSVMFKVPEEKRTRLNRTTEKSIENKMREEYEEEEYEWKEEPAFPKEEEQKEASAFFMIAGGLCFAAGIVRIIRRLLIRYGKL